MSNFAGGNAQTCDISQVPQQQGNVFPSRYNNLHLSTVLRSTPKYASQIKFSTVYYRIQRTITLTKIQSTSETFCKNKQSTGGTEITTV
jgi:hypothetical protein